MQEINIFSIIESLPFKLHVLFHLFVLEYQQTCSELMWYIYICVYFTVINVSLYIYSLPAITC